MVDYTYMQYVSYKKYVNMLLPITSVQIHIHTIMLKLFNLIKFLSTINNW